MVKVLTVLSMVGFYINWYDPRVFIYRHPTRTWQGITLNCARWQSWLLLGVLIALWYLEALLIRRLFECLGFPHWKVTALCLFCIVLIPWAFHAAKKDLERHPGPRSTRPFSRSEESSTMNKGSKT